MARTTVGAAKATSGAAPRVKPSLKQACTASGRTARVISSRAKATRGASSRATRSASVESISSLSTLTTVPSSPVHGDMLLPASQQMDRWPTNRYCYLCHNGIVCQYCLGLAEVKPEICASDVSFKCPGCHELGERDARCKLSPYHAFTRNIDGRSTQVLEGPVIIRGVCERASKTQVCAESILILHLVCVGMERRGSLPKLLYTSLEDYHTQDSLVYEEVFFDFGTDEKLVRWSKKASLLGARLAERNFGRKIIFVTVHSEVNRGDLFAGKDRNGNDVAMEVADFVNCLFNPPLDKVVYASTLFMLTCGHVVAFEESYKAMKQAIMRLRPEFTIMFTAPDFISAVVKAFIVTYSIQVLIQGHDLVAIFQDILNTSIDLRMHTDVILFYIEDIHGTTVIAVLGASLCPWGARNVALFVRGPDRNVRKMVRAPTLGRWLLWGVTKKLCTQRRGCPLVWGANQNVPNRRITYGVIGDRASNVYHYRKAAHSRTPLGHKTGCSSKTRFSEDFTDWLDTLDETSQLVVPPVVLSAVSIFQENEVSNPTDPRTVPRDMLLLRGDTSSHDSRDADAPPPTWLRRTPGHPTTALVSVWHLVPLFAALAYHEMDNYANRAAILRWTAAFEPRLFYWGLMLIPRGYYVNDDGHFVTWIISSQKVANGSVDSYKKRDTIGFAARIARREHYRRRGKATTQRANQRCITERGCMKGLELQYTDRMQAGKAVKRA
ncbi:hypothetical protein EDD15DRAFT_2204872 [Pisolithus albus]|nr:hypothetical protein EDD15DRAFT_2204872 [Pisolithus albus]